MNEYLSPYLCGYRKGFTINHELLIAKLHAYGFTREFSVDYP